MTEKGAQGDQTGDTGDQKIKVGEKEYSAEDVANLVANVSTSTEKAQKVSQILDACAKYEMEPEEFLQQAIGGFTVINGLIQEGVIDTQGNLVKKEVKKEEKKGNLDDLFNLDGKSQKAPVGEEKIAAIVAKVLQPFTETLNKGLGDVKDIQTSMIRNEYQKDIISKFPNLDAEDVSKVFGIAMQDRSKDIWAVAEAASKNKVEKLEALNKEFAKSHGLDYDKLIAEQDENKLNEQDAKGGAASLAKDRKITFRHQKQGEKGFVTPLELTKEYFRNVDGG